MIVKVRIIQIKIKVEMIIIKSQKVLWVKEVSQYQGLEVAEDMSKTIKSQLSGETSSTKQNSGDESSSGIKGSEKFDDKRYEWYARTT